jgi:hypothetical protein
VLLTYIIRKIRFKNSYILSTKITIMQHFLKFV